jgi:hypothetical protein
VNFRGMWGNVGIHRCAKAELKPFIRRSLNGQTESLTVTEWPPGSGRSQLQVRYRNATEEPVNG